MAFAIPSRAKILNAVETLVIGTAGGMLFLWANLPGGLISGAMIAVGIAAIAGRPLAVPPILTQTVLVLPGIAPSSPPAAAGAIASPLELTELIAASVAAALLLRLIKFPASWMFGAMIGSSMLHGTGLIEGGLPPWVRGVALVGIGALIGSRFARMTTKTMLSHSSAALGSFAIAIVISALFVAVIALTTHVRLADIIVAFAPGRK